MLEAVVVLDITVLALVLEALVVAVLVQQAVLQLCSLLLAPHIRVEVAAVVAKLADTVPLVETADLAL
jgi:hypothetical protein